MFFERSHNYTQHLHLFEQKYRELNTEKKTNIVKYYN